MSWYKPPNTFSMCGGSEGQYPVLPWNLWMQFIVITFINEYLLHFHHGIKYFCKHKCIGKSISLYGIMNLSFYSFWCKLFLWHFVSYPPIDFNQLWICLVEFKFMISGYFMLSCFWCHFNETNLALDVTCWHVTDVLMSCMKFVDCQLICA